MSPLFKKTPKSSDNVTGTDIIRTGAAETGLKGMFGIKEKTPAASHEIEEWFGNIGRRIRILEDRYNNLRKQFQFADIVVIKNKKELSTEIKAMDMTLSEINKEIRDLNEKTEKMASEISGCAKLTDLKTVEKYVDLWRPVNFLTREQAMRMIKEYAEKNK